MRIQFINPFRWIVNENQVLRKRFSIFQESILNLGTGWIIVLCRICNTKTIEPMSGHRNLLHVAFKNFTPYSHGTTKWVWISLIWRAPNIWDILMISTISLKCSYFGYTCSQINHRSISKSQSAISSKRAVTSESNQYETRKLTYNKGKIYTITFSGILFKNLAKYFLE